MFSACGTARIDACQKAGLPIMNGSGLFFEHHMDEIGGVPSAQLFQQIGAVEVDRAWVDAERPSGFLGGVSACMNEITGCGPDVGQFRGSNASDGRSTPSAIGIALRVFPS
jgi:hypothetical protein